jgi:hypothetical protein
MMILMRAFIEHYLLHGNLGLCIPLSILIGSTRVPTLRLHRRARFAQDKAVSTDCVLAGFNLL